MGWWVGRGRERGRGGREEEVEEPEGGGGSTVATSSIWPGDFLDLSLTPPCWRPWFPAWSVYLDSLGGQQGAWWLFCGATFSIACSHTHSLNPTPPPPPPPSSEEGCPRDRSRSSQSYIVHSSTVSRHGFLLFAHAPFFFFFFFQYRKLRKMNCCSVRLNWFCLDSHSTAVFFCFVLFHFSRSRMRGPALSHDHSSGRHQRGWSIKPVTPPSSSSFFLLLPTFRSMRSITITVFCLYMVPATVYLCRFERVIW